MAHFIRSNAFEIKLYETCYVRYTLVFILLLEIMHCTSIYNFNHMHIVLELIKLCIRLTRKSKSSLKVLITKYLGF